MTKVIDISGMTKQEVKNLVSLEGYNKNTFYSIWKRGTMKVSVSTSKIAEDE